MEIATACARGERAAQHLLFQTHKNWVMGVCVRYMGSLDAEDVFQETFMKIFNKITQFQGNASLKTWMRHLVVSQCIDTLRKNKKLKMFVELDEQFVTDKPEDFENTEELLQPEEALEMLNSLPERYRVCLNLFAVEKYNYKQIAEILNMNEGTCRGNVSKAREMLREMLHKKKGLNHEKYIAS